MTEAPMDQYFKLQLHVNKISKIMLLTSDCPKELEGRHYQESLSKISANYWMIPKEYIQSDITHNDFFKITEYFIEIKKPNNLNPN